LGGHRSVSRFRRTNLAGNDGRIPGRRGAWWVFQDFMTWHECYAAGKKYKNQIFDVGDGEL
jgi:hypothetical protein